MTKINNIINLLRLLNKNKEAQDLSDFNTQKQVELSNLRAEIDLLRSENKDLIDEVKKLNRSNKALNDVMKRGYLIE